MKHKDWTDQLPELLENYTEPAPEGLWEGVSGSLPRRRSLAAWWWAPALVAAAACLALVVFLWPGRPAGRDAAPVAQAQEAAAAPSLPETAPSLPETVPEALPEALPETFPEAADASAPADASPAPADASPAPADPSPVPADPSAPDIADTPSTVPDAPETGIQAAEEGPAAPPLPVVIPLEEQIRRSSAAGGLRLALRTEGCLSPSQTLTTTGYGLPSTSATLPGGISLRMLSRNKASTSESVHSQSARISLGVQYAFLPRLAVESGLCLTNLQSTTTTVTGTAQSSSVRRMQYLGVPLMLHFDAFEWWRLGFYLQAGPMYEWCVGTQVTEVSGLGERLLDDTQSNQRVEDGIWSLQAAAGVQLRLFQHGALFVQPGFSWHIPGPTPVENYYTTHPTAFSLSFGFRFIL